MQILNGKIPLFECGDIYLCRTRQEWIKAHESLGATADLLDRKGAANTFRSNQGDIYILGWFDGSFATLAQEAAHLAFDICASVGVEVSAGRSNETYCYLLDWIIRLAEKNQSKMTGFVRLTLAIWRSFDLNPATA